MAEKSFGIKEINLIGASGTPTIESPNNLNLNAVNVAISTNVSVGGTLTVSGNLSVGGTITYDDVTNIDSVGIITAREGIFLPDNKTLHFGNTVGSADGTIHSDGSNFLIQGTNASQTYLRGSTINISVNGGLGSYGNSIICDESGGSRVQLCYNSNQKLITTNTGVDIDGSVNIIYFSITASGASAYRFSGGGVDTTEDNPDIYLIRGYTYRFYNTTGSSHPFAIRSAVTNSGGTDYTDGVSGNQNNYQTFTVPLDAPSNLYYQCTVHTQNMQGNIYIIGVGGRSTLTRDTTLTGSSLTFDGIPPWANKITVNLHKASLSGSDQIYVRLRSGSSSITSNYDSVSANFQGNVSSNKSDAFNINTTGDSQITSGSMIIEKIDSDGLKYIQTNTFQANNNTRHGAGQLDRSSGSAISGIEITRENSNTFDGGTVTIYYE